MAASSAKIAAFSRLDGEGLTASAWSSRASPLSYSASAKLMHWFVAATIIVFLAEGPVMKRLVPEGWLRDNLYNFREVLGALILIVMVVRLARRIPIPREVSADLCSYLHNRLRLDRERIILSDQNAASKAHKSPPKLIQAFRAPFPYFGSGGGRTAS
jgi:hypothetical protein